MEQEQILAILSHVIQGGCSPYHHKAKEPKKFADQVFAKTAEEQGDYINEQRLRETPEQKKQRIRLTNPITPAAISPALAYVEELQRTDGVHRMGVFQDTTRFQEVEQSLGQYYAGQSIQDFAFNAVKMANKQDPNSWLIFERKELPDAAGYKFYPVLVESERVVDWRFNEFGTLDYLVFSEEEYQSKRIDGGQEIAHVNHFYLYAPGYAAFAQYMGDDSTPRYEDQAYTIDDAPDYLVWIFETGTIETPAIRLGAYQSELDVNAPCELLYEPARGYLKDLMGIKSSLDLNMVIHMYLRLFQYVKACEAVDDQGLSCIGGYYGADHKRPCATCGGTGKIIHGGEQDVVTFKFPDTKEEFVDLAQVAHYLVPPIEVLLNQQDQVKYLASILTYVIYSQEQSQEVNVQTATQFAINYSRIYNKLYPIALKVGEVESLAYRVAMQYYGAFRDGDNYHVTFPMDFAMKKESELIADLAAAKAAGAPYSVQKAISDALLKKKHKDNPAFVNDQLAFDALKPFSDKSPEELAMILATRSKTDPKRVAWENWQEIQHNIQSRIKAKNEGLARSETKAAFYLYPMETQRKEIAEDVAAIIAAMPAETNSFNQLPVFQ
jgi:hypothetical protein